MLEGVNFIHGKEKDQDKDIESTDISQCIGNSKIYVTCRKQHRTSQRELNRLTKISKYICINKMKLYRKFPKYHAHWMRKFEEHTSGWIFKSLKTLISCRTSFTGCRS